MNTLNTRQIDPTTLARLMAVEDAQEELWTNDDMASMFHHQLSLPLSSCLAGYLPAEDEGGLEALHLERTFGEVLTDLHPELQLLLGIKAWAKEEWRDPDSDLPRALPIALYFLAIAVALSRCGRRITSLSRERLKKSFRTVLGATWLDAPSRGLIEEGLEALEAPAAV